MLQSPGKNIDEQVGNGPVGARPAGVIIPEHLPIRLERIALMGPQNGPKHLKQNVESRSVVLFAPAERQP